mmetsp:Transcript_13559/g.18602  ORF Transcript_13559/g.18602 Transcript_13559/m.18602 type:complete len:318 (+) Transcript_13559:84-1037(+)
MSNYNPRNPAVKRILMEIREFQRATESSHYTAAPLEDNIFEWHFNIRGPSGSDYEGGIYHGRILLPSEYPMKPPNIVLLTPNGRFEIGTKICLSVSAHHPEEWKPSWGIRTILLALSSFMPTQGKGAIGAIEVSSAERKRLAGLSLSWKCDKCFLDQPTPLSEETPSLALSSDDLPVLAEKPKSNESQSSSSSSSDESKSDDPSSSPSSETESNPKSEIDDSQQQNVSSSSSPSPSQEDTLRKRNVTIPQSTQQPQQPQRPQQNHDHQYQQQEQQQQQEQEQRRSQPLGLRILDLFVVFVFFALTYLLVKKYVTLNH